MHLLSKSYSQVIHNQYVTSISANPIYICEMGFEYKIVNQQGIYFLADMNLSKIRKTIYIAVQGIILPAKVCLTHYLSNKTSDEK